MEISVENSSTFRNSRIWVGVVMFASFVGYAFAVCALLVVLTEIFPLHDFTGSRAFNILRWLLFGLVFFALGIRMWRTAMKMAHSRAQLDVNGVHFSLGPAKKAQEAFFPWTEITAVSHKRIGNYQWYGVKARDGASVEFTSYTFVRPKKLALLIATRANQQIQEVR